MKKVALVVHGWNVMRPLEGVGKLRPVLEKLGYLVEYYPYGYWPLPIQVSRRNPKFAKQLTDRCVYWANKGYEVTVVCHSNGAAITKLANDMYQAPIDKVLAIHPALKKYLHPCGKAKKVVVAHNQGDKIVVAGGLLGIFTKFINEKWETARPWGQMGQDGYTGGAATVENVDTQPPCSGHSDEFNYPEVLEMLIKRLEK